MHAKSQKPFLSAVVNRKINSESAERRFTPMSRLAAPRSIPKTAINWHRATTRLWRLLLLSVTAMTLCLGQDSVSIIHGTIRKIDRATKTLVVRTADGADHTIQVTDQATIHGTKDGFAGLSQGSAVVVRSAAKGRQSTADDLGRLGKDGMRIMEGTIENLDQGTKTITVRDAEGNEKTFEYTDRAENDLAKVVVRGAEKGARVTVYYTEEGSKKIAYFFASGHRHSRPNPLATSAKWKKEEGLLT
jgi:hypothetical protein